MSISSSFPLADGLRTAAGCCDGPAVPWATAREPTGYKTVTGAPRERAAQTEPTISRRPASTPCRTNPAASASRAGRPPTWKANAAAPPATPTFAGMSGDRRASSERRDDEQRRGERMRDAERARRRGRPRRSVRAPCRRPRRRAPRMSTGRRRGEARAAHAHAESRRARRARRRAAARARARRGRPPPAEARSERGRRSRRGAVRASGRRRRRRRRRRPRASRPGPRARTGTSRIASPARPGSNVFASGRRRTARRRREPDCFRRASPASRGAAPEREREAAAGEDSSPGSALPPAEKGARDIDTHLRPAQAPDFPRAGPGPPPHRHRAVTGAPVTDGASGRAAAPRARRQLARLEPPRQLPRVRRGGSCAPRCRGRGRPAPGRSRARPATPSASSISAQCGSRRVEAGRARSLGVRSATSRRVVSVSCVPVYTTEFVAVVLGPVRVRPASPSKRTAARPCRAGRARRAARTTAGVITPRSSAISGSAPELALGRVERAPRPGPRRQCPPRASRARAGTPSRRRSRGSGRCARGRTSSNARAQPLDPPAVARRAQRRPVVERVAPALAARAERVGRRARDARRAGRAPGARGWSAPPGAT